MKGLLCGLNVKTNEEYKIIIKKRNFWAVVIILLGVAAFGIGFFVNEAEVSSIPPLILGFYSGIGLGLAIAGVVLLIKNRMLLNDETKLKESRLKQSDERLVEASNLAVRTALKFMILAMSIICLFGIFAPIVLKVILLIMLVFIISYYIAYAYYQKKL